LPSSDYATLDQLTIVFRNVLAIVTTVGGFLAFGAIILSGFRFLTAQGDPKALISARSTITWAIVGLAFIIFAWLILLFISQFTGIDVTRFCIGLDCD
jgi:hypothetical protein